MLEYATMHDSIDAMLWPLNSLIAGSVLGFRLQEVQVPSVTCLPEAQLCR
jgi:hypothetical protein